MHTKKWDPLYYIISLSPLDYFSIRNSEKEINVKGTQFQFDTHCTDDTSLKV